VRIATAKSVHELFAKDCPLEEKKEMVFLTATFTVTVAFAAPEGEHVKSPESDRVRCVTVKREAELRSLNSSSSFKPPRCKEKSNGFPAMYQVK